MQHFTKNLILKFILVISSTIPVSSCFADPAIDAKIAEVKARMLRDFAPPKASQYLNRHRAQQSSATEGEAPAQQQAPQNNSPSAPAGGGSPSSQPSTWNYVQPGDTGPPPNSSASPSNGSPSGASFDHSHLY